MYGNSLESGVLDTLSTTLLSGILIQGHDRVGYFNHGRCPASISEAVKHSRRSRRKLSEFCLSYTTVEGEGDKEGKVDQN